MGLFRGFAQVKKALGFAQESNLLQIALKAIALPNELACKPSQ